MEKSRARSFEMESDYVISNESLGEINLPNHPLVDGLGSFSGDIRILHQKVNPGATIVASWADGTPLVTFRSSPNLVVDLNFYPNIDYWNTDSDGLKLIQNALNWTTRSFSPLGFQELLLKELLKEDLIKLWNLYSMLQV